MDIIQLLPDNIANQIAAGEVIQRPASAAKEMLENSIDSGASNIKLVIKDSGKTLIQVIDNGCGMSNTDAQMSFERHATSKIKKANDLFNLKTMGFRGEAMASMAAIAHIELITKLTENELGTKIIIEGSEIKKQESVVCANGTSISLKNLFYNVPARRKFLKSDKIEKKHIIEQFSRVALSNPEISFILTIDDQEYYHLEKSNFRQRIVNIIGKKTNEKLAPVEEETNLVKINGFIGKPEFSKRTRGEQYFFVNGRFIKNHYLNHAVSKAFSDLIAENYHPSYFLNLEINPKNIDVNIHPTKTEITFSDEQSIYAILRASVKKSLGQYNIAPTLDFNKDPVFEIPVQNEKSVIKEPKIKIDKNYNPFETDSKEEIFESHKIYQNTLQKEFQSEIKLNLKPEPTDYYQINKTYIMSQSNMGLIIVDQERAHQRVLYENFMKNKNIKISSQKLLFPEKISLSKTDISEISNIKNELNNIGFEFNIQEDYIEIHATPKQCENENLEKLFFEILKEQEIENSSLKKKFKSRICKALSNSLSIKSEKKLTQEEMKSLVTELLKCEIPSMSPSGLNTYFNINIQDLNKKFNKC